MARGGGIATRTISLCSHNQEGKAVTISLGSKALFTADILAVLFGCWSLFEVCWVGKWEKKQSRKYMETTFLIELHVMTLC